MANEDESQAEPPPAPQGPSDNKDEIKGGSSSPDINNNGSGSDSGAEPTFRTQLGSFASAFTDVVNNNLIIVRYATTATVVLLGAYGMANTPLFYRYKNLNDIANKVFTKRQRIHGRIVGVLDNGSGRQFASTSSQSSEHWRDVAAVSSSAVNSYGGNDHTQSQQQRKPVTILFRHSSPMERLLTQSAMEKIMKVTTAREESTSLLYSSSSSNMYRNLLPIELAGIVTPPTIAPTNRHSASVLSTTLTKGPSTPSSNPTSSLVPEVLQSLIEKKTRVSLQMLALRTSPSTNGTKKSMSPSIIDESNIHSAICHLNYRKPTQWLSTTNLALELVQRGKALVNQDGLIPTNDDNSVSLIDFNPTVKQLQNDSTFISQLEEAEFAAWKSREGVWLSPQMRELRKEYAEEEEYLNSSLWSRLKRGLSWIIGRAESK